ncbi:putative solute carrier family 35 member SLC35F1/F2/F6 [Helianthus annuus]|nr:putative solute carrier family 35 member SLC35F1/F2/F6 [Helianthus annuus]
MFLFYSGVPVLLKISGSTMLNLSLLTSDMWSVLLRIFVYREKVDWIYFVAFAAVAVGLVVYSVYVFSFYFSYVIHLFGFGNGLGSKG